MSRLSTFLTSSLVAAAVTLALPAHARFGKGGSGGGSGGGSHSSGRSGSGGGAHYHPAGPSAGGGYRGGGGGGSVVVVRNGWAGRPASGWGYRHRTCWGWFCGGYGWGYGDQPLFYSAPVIVAGPSMGVSTEPAREPEPQQAVFTLGALGQGFTAGGVSLGVTAGFEQARFGVSTEFNSLFLPADDGSGGTDHLRLWNTHVTYALLCGDRGRLRVGAGVDTAFAQDATFVGPGLMANAAVGVFGPLGLEGSVHLTPLPFVQVDWSAGAALALGPLGLRAGWRRIYLSDQGVVDGTIHEDVFAGPYLGVALAL